MRIGILGGTFNPIHNGHLTIAKEAKEKLELDKVILMPAFIPPHKVTNDIADAQDRFNMATLAVEGLCGFEVSRYEIDKEGASYSVETLKYLKASLRDAELFFIIGEDSLGELDSWKEINSLFDICRFVVFNRPSYAVAKTRFEEKIQRIEITGVNISSTQIRDKIKTHEDISAFLPKAVAEYIKKRTLYK